VGLVNLIAIHFKKSFCFSYSRKDIDVNVRAGQLKSGYTPLHFAVADTSEQHSKCLDLLLSEFKTPF
jgi:hypothetical protein